MSFESLLQSSADVYRKQDWYVNGECIDFTVGSTPSSQVIMNAELTAMTVGGTVTIIGECNGDTRTENLNFSSTGVRVGETHFTFLNEISFVGLSGTMRVFATGPSGEEVNSSSVVYSDMPVRLYRIEKDEELIATGSVLEQTMRVMYEPGYSLNIEDILLISSIKYAITNISPIYDANSLHHYEGMVKKVTY